MPPPFPLRIAHPLLYLAAVVCLSACQSLSHTSPQPATETGFLDRSIDVGQLTHKYQVYLPSNYSADRDWPLLLFLHGAGERGYGGLSQTHVGLGRAIRFHPDRWPAVVVFPQLPPGKNWTPSTEPIGTEALNATIKEFAIDTSRVYLTGLSMGGYGSLYLGQRHADRFAAIVAICPTVGDGSHYPFVTGSSYKEAISGSAEALSKMPIWLFHGEQDPVFAASISSDLSRALQ
ncbi:MAG: phospholipase, partial [Bacteroidetes bacterium]|nr:phospholipase [Bacteroidota bacterium]